MPTKEQTVLVIDRLLESRDTAKASADNPIFRGKSYCIDVERLAAQDMRHDEAREILSDLRKKNCFVFENRQSESDFSSVVDSSFFRQKPANVVFLNIAEVHSLALYECKRELLGKKGKSIIKPLALQYVARKIGDADVGTNLITMLRECGVPDYLIVYPNTKWRMVNDIFRVLATSTDETDHKLLFGILEEFCHPLRYGGDKERAQDLRDEITALIEYDDYYFVDGSIMKIVNESPEEDSHIRAIQQDIEKRKEARSQRDAKGLANMSQLFDQFNQRATLTRLEQMQRRQPTPDPVSIVINNQNIQNNMAQSVPKDSVPREVYDYHELHIDLGRRILRNTTKNVTKDLTGFNYHFLRLLLVAHGNVVSYQTIADAVRDDTVGKLNEKDVMDRKSVFIRWLKEQLEISAGTADSLIEGKGGYRINRMVYEETTKVF